MFVIRKLEAIPSGTPSPAGTPNLTLQIHCVQTQALRGGGGGWRLFGAVHSSRLKHITVALSRVYCKVCHG
jgi:hypothetical protein